MTEEENNVHAAAIESLRSYVTSLRSEQRRSEERIEAIVEEQRLLDDRLALIDDELEAAEASLYGLAMTNAPQLVTPPPPEQSEQPRKRRPPVPLEVARDTMQQMGEFTIPELAALLDIGLATARRLTMEALEPGGQDGRPMVEKTGRKKRPERGQGQSADVYVFVKPESNGHAPHSRPRSAPDVELRRIGATPAPTGRKLRLRKDTAEMVAEARQLGYNVERLKNNHVRVTTADGQYVDTIASTGSDHRGAKNSSAKMRRAQRAA